MTGGGWSASTLSIMDEALCSVGASDGRTIEMVSKRSVPLAGVAVPTLLGGLTVVDAAA